MIDLVIHDGPLIDGSGAPLRAAPEVTAGAPAGRPLAR
jgi:hypothetical protein